ncbi:zinc finger and SCAN domain-containing protein 29-like isoform X2 [Elephas maximus indicus]|nr:zinc finger and SCAN domain-containing protein 29-like isoform X2 [Elephas maximus indicus]XP_049761587.1 zinc finger and SCAN domain-containing protein 29-like isoform X2 [Elephas maximus indicus]
MKNSHPEPEEQLHYSSKVELQSFHKSAPSDPQAPGLPVEESSDQETMSSSPEAQRQPDPGQSNHCMEITPENSASGVSSDFPTHRPSMRAHLSQETPQSSDLQCPREESVRGSSVGGVRVRPGQGPVLRRAKAWDELEWQGLEDERVAGVHWSYEETKIFLGILSESWIHEKLQTCHQNHQVYWIVAERLRERGFLRILEQCHYRFKNLQTKYCKARSTHTPGICAFYDEMDALMRPQATTPIPEVAGCLLGQRHHDVKHEELQRGCWEQEEVMLAEAVLEGRSGKQGPNLDFTASSLEEGHSGAMTEDSDGEELGVEELSGSPGISALFRSPTGVHRGRKKLKFSWGFLVSPTFMRNSGPAIGTTRCTGL